MNFDCIGSCKFMAQVDVNYDYEKARSYFYAPEFCQNYFSRLN
jgi:hypothetical protein